MATVFRKPASRFWWTAYFDGEGVRRYRSTGKRQKSEAVAAAAEMERRARQAGPGDDEQRRRIMRLLEDAGEQALRGTLSTASAHALLGRISEAATGETLKACGIEEWIRTWLKEKKGARSSGTFTRYEGVVDGFLASLPAAKRGMPLGTLAVSDLQRFRDGLVAEGRSEDTANLAVKILRTALNAARRQGIIPTNPAEALEMLASSKGGKDIFRPEDVSALLAVAGNEWRGLILAGYYTGARAGDLSNLPWFSVDLERGTIRITQGKTKRFTEIPIHGDLGKWLQAEREARTNKSPFVFPSFAGKTVGSRNGLSGQFRLLMAKAGIAGKITAKSGSKGRNRSSLTFHSFRHSFNSAMANAGVAQELRQRLTGHASKAVNDIYTHTELSALRGAVDAVPSINSQRDTNRTD